ncbi:MAG: alkaline phosphatase D family protein [Alcanivoracaceae bacterium]|nr:alkaline phosphatase D family protein [Alcanivoracaceae bacterium]
MTLTRRDMLILSGAASLAGLSGCGADSSDAALATAMGADTDDRGPASVPPPPRVSFRHGVASGDPLSDRVILWTRVTPADDTALRIPVTVQVARDPSMQQLVTVIETYALASNDFCVKVDAAGLLPDHWYYYRFRVGGQMSPVGRTRTFPAMGSAKDRARFAVVSCSNYAYGLFSAYRALANATDLDFILHLGDYVYEYGAGEYGDFPGREPQPPHEMVTLSDYRQRHAQYKTDTALQALHQQVPFVVTWDDHESANDSYRDGAENHDPLTEGDWQQRQGAARQAYAEWMPIRDDMVVAGEIYRAMHFGDLIDLLMLDTRLEGRDQQVTNPADPARNSADRQLISPAQMGWLQDRLAASQSRWRFLGQQVMFAQLNIAEIPGIEDDPELRGNLVAINMDQWDGYAADRQALLNFLADNDIRDTVILTGDIHTSWANEIYRNPATLLGDLFDEPLAAEFVTPAVTSPGFPEGAAEAASLAIPLANPHIRYTELKSRGFILMDVTRERAQAEFYYVRTIESLDLMGQLDDSKTKVVAVRHGSSRIVEDTPRSSARTVQSAMRSPKPREVMA